MGRFATYLEARQAASNAGVPPSLRTPHGRRLVRIANASVAVSALGALLMLVLLATASTAWMAYVAASLVITAGVLTGTITVGRLAGLERSRR